MSEPTAYELYRSGIDLLERRDHHAAALPLQRARDLEPTTGMVREALGRALFGSQRYREAAEEFGVLVELEPVNHYAQFCLGRALQLQGLHAEARPPLTMAALLQPQRADYAVYRDRTIAALAGADGAPDDRPAPSADAGAEEPPPGSRRSGAGPWGAPAADAGTGGTVGARDGADAPDADDDGPGSTGTDGPARDPGSGGGSGSTRAPDSTGEAGSTRGDDVPEELGGPPPRA
ncbi:tetratricopeptide repeat protein [Patulibacter sp.]|uniref:tetratricopeptide repeat protein n=1 Tax=Patulibacter sp. TaxID=1912859 RepID=UPI002721A914|nr:tetratricopeptide repeat protein [Patulibacter sp.]MDO9408567.1 tetratricopeptide repeat protein [Patulibacter sp.]